MNLQDARAHILKCLQEGLSPRLTYHNVEHTQDVVKSALALAYDEGVTNSSDLICLELACWMHDTGFIVSPHQHEKKSCQFVDDWLPSFGIDDQFRKTIKQLIRSTQLHSPATSLMEQIIQDADLDYLGRDDYWEKAEGLRLEMESRGQSFSDRDWIEFQIHFLSTHRYNTQSAVQRRQGGKRDHLRVLQTQR